MLSLRKILCKLLCESKKVRVVFTISSDGSKIKIRSRKIKMELKEGTQVQLGVALLTKVGHPASYEKGSAVWTVTGDKPETVSLEVNPDDELVATLKGVDGSNNDSVLVTFHADGDPDTDNVRDVEATLAVTVTQGEAVVAQFVVGEATDTP